MGVVLLHTLTDINHKQLVLVVQQVVLTQITVN
jgi:hypothetical protein